MKPIQIFLGTSKAPFGWTHVKSYHMFEALLDTVSLREIIAISFEEDLEDDEERETEVPFTGYDCAVKLTEVAGNRALPDCFVHDGSQAIRNVLDYYCQSYHHPQRCMRHTVELVN